MIGFFQEDENSRSMSRLCMLIGVCSGGISGIALVIVYMWAQIIPNGWICAVPLSLMVGGCLPYISNKINEIKEKILDNPKLIEQLTSLIRGMKNA